MNKTQKLMAEEVLDRNTDHIVKIITPISEGGVLPGVSEMVPVKHVGPEGCFNLAFYYTHRINRANNELPIATRAKFADGTRPDRCQPIICSSCKKTIRLMCDLRWEGEV